MLKIIYNGFFSITYNTVFLIRDKYYNMIKKNPSTTSISELCNDTIYHVEENTKLNKYTVNDNNLIEIINKDIIC